MKKNRTLALILVCVMLLGLLSACGSSEETTTSPGTPTTETAATDNASQATSDASESSAPASTSGHLNVGYVSDPGTLDPFSSMSGARYQTIPFIYERLASWGDEGAVLTGNLAREWEDLGDNTFRFYLYDYITDSQGNVFNADDVVWVLEKHLEMGTNTNALYVEKVEKVDDFTVDVTLTEDTCGIFETFCNGVFYCTQEAYEASPDGMSSDPVGTGPYVLASAEMGNSYEYVRRDDYWQDADKLTNPDQYSNFESFTIKIISESSQQVIALQTGTIDFIELSSNAEAAMKFLDDPEFTVYAPDGNSSTLMYLNMHEGSVFADNPALRRAIFYGFDVQDIADGVYAGYAKPSVTFGANIYTDCNPDWTYEDYFVYDADYAAEQLAEAGYKSGELTLRLLCSSNAAYSSTAEIIQAYLGQLGIVVEINAYENALYETYKLDWTQWDMILDSKGAADYLASYFRTKLSPSSYSDEVYTCCFIRDDTLDELVDAAIRYNTHSLETVSAVHDYLLDQCFVRGLVVNDKIFVYRNAVISSTSFNADYKHEYGKFTPAQ